MLVTWTSFQNRPLPGCDRAARSWAASIFCRRRSSAISPAGRGGFGGGPWAVMGSAVAGAGAVEWKCRHWRAGRRARAEGVRRAARRGTTTRRRDIAVLRYCCCRVVVGDRLWPGFGQLCAPRHPDQVTVTARHSITVRDKSPPNPLNNTFIPPKKNPPRVSLPTHPEHVPAILVKRKKNRKKREKKDQEKTPFSP